MKELIEYIAKQIADLPDKVVVTEESDDQGTTLRLQVAEEDKGRVIGREGQTVTAMRALVKVIAGKRHEKIRLEIS